MNPYPLHPGERAEIRKAIRDRLIANAEREALVFQRSIKCADGDHGHLSEQEHTNRLRLHGCANNGTTCICECHDGATK